MANVVTLHVEIEGSDALENCKIYKNGKILEVRQGMGSNHMEFTYTDVAYDGTKNSHYYIEVTQIDGEMAWTSPVFIKAARD